MNRENNASEKISIIIPVYNAEKYIESTLNNLFAQTYKNYEIIIAFDTKTTDKTLDILQKINETHPIIIDIGNDSSTGSARNRGLRLASGKYIVFVDSDDVILPEYLQSMLDVFKKYPEMDVVCCNALFLKDTEINKGLQIAQKKEPSITTYNHHDAILLKIFDTLPWGVWAHMIKKSYLERYNLQLPDYTVREDLVFTLQLFINTDKIGYNVKPVYLYLKHPDTVTTQKFDKWFDNSQPSRKDLAELAKKLPQDAAEELKFRDDRLVAAGCACKYDYRTYREKLKEYGVSRLSFYRGGDSFTGKVSVVAFSLSKFLYYRCIRFMKKI